MPTTTITSAVRAVAIVLTLAAPSAALAQGVCPEGKAPGGGCVDAGLASAMRQGTVFGTHPKINATVPLNMPSEDGLYAGAKDRFENVRIFGPRIPNINNPYDYQINIPAQP